MKRAILTSGPRGSGKSMYSKLFVKNNLEFNYFSRDKILLEMYGQTALDSQEKHELAEYRFFENVKNFIENSGDNYNIIVDYWNGGWESRSSIVRRLRNLDVERVVCWKFVTPPNTVVDWFFHKQDVKNFSEESVRSDYQLYHLKSKNLEKENFDKIYLINPLQLDLFLK